MHDLFISYSRRNATFVNRLAADLEDHGLDVWLDTIEITVGDSVHKTVEQGIRDSRFFCFALSPAALDSFYVREVEFEQAFSRMVAGRREGYILPVVVQSLVGDVPDRIAHLHRLDFTKRKLYAQNVKSMVDKIRGVDGDYSGSRWYKGLNISNLGQPAGVGPTSQKASLGMSYNIKWNSGVVSRVDVYNNGALAHYKEFEYDNRGRVVANKMYSPDGSGGWAVRDDVWYYAYDLKTGVRATKTMRYLGEATARVVQYDSLGRPTVEEIVTDAGRTPDRSFPYGRKVFDYDVDGNPVGELWFDQNGKGIPAV
ncbi:toll/interleukin-1 receptor domain-containing protein [Streptomyces sp. NPDC002276]